MARDLKNRTYRSRRASEAPLIPLSPDIHSLTCRKCGVGCAGIELEGQREAHLCLQCYLLNKYVPVYCPDNFGKRTHGHGMFMVGEIQYHGGYVD